MKYIIHSLAAILLVALIGCGKDPANPKFRVKNEHTNDASLQVKTSGGNTININNVKPATTSEYQEVAVGTVDITLTVQGVNGTFTGSFNAETDKTYTVTVKNTNPPTVVTVNP